MAGGLSLGTRRIAPALHGSINTVAGPVAEAAGHCYVGGKTETTRQHAK